MAQRVRKRPVTVPKPRYRVGNWGDYNRALVARGSITVWIEDEVLAGWRATGGRGGATVTQRSSARSACARCSG